jgi:hypothetical protein
MMKCFGRIILFFTTAICFSLPCSILAQKTASQQSSHGSKANSKKAQGSAQSINIGEDDMRAGELDNMLRRKHELAETAAALSKRAATERDSAAYARDYIALAQAIRAEHENPRWNQVEEIAIPEPPKPSDHALQQLKELMVRTGQTPQRPPATKPAQTPTSQQQQLLQQLQKFQQSQNNTGEAPSAQQVEPPSRINMDAGQRPQMEKPEGLQQLLPPKREPTSGDSRRQESPAGNNDGDNASPDDSSRSFSAFPGKLNAIPPDDGSTTGT